jgi:hypothetical protein
VTAGDWLPTVSFGGWLTGRDPTAAVRGSGLPVPKLPLSSAKTSARRRHLTQTGMLFGSARGVRLAGPGSRREVALGLLRSHDPHRHAELLDAVGEVEVQPS